MKNKMKKYSISTIFIVLLFFVTFAFANPPLRNLMVFDENFMLNFNQHIKKYNLSFLEMKEERFEDLQASYTHSKKIIHNVGTYNIAIYYDDDGTFQKASFHLSKPDIINNYKSLEKVSKFLVGFSKENPDIIINKLGIAKIFDNYHIESKYLKKYTTKGYLFDVFYLKDVAYDITITKRTSFFSL